ncbi:MAG: DNA-binding protein [Euryarchaeota archaeon]|nr:DNA-binding protein [Euryarchaeota archaeon]
MSEFEDAVEEVYNALEGKVDKESIFRELKEFMDMRVPLNEAKRSVIRKYGGTVKNLGSEYRSLASLVPGEGRLNLRVKILSINPKEYTTSDGEVRKMFYGNMGDESGVLPFTAWQLNIAIRKGDCVEIKNAYTREWQGQTKVMLGQNTRIELLPPDSVKVKSTLRQAKVAELHPGMGLVEVEAKILSAEPRTVSVDGVEKTVYSGTLADETGEIPFSAWDTEVRAGDVLKISRAYVSTFRGMPQLVFDSRSEITKLNREIEITEVPVSIDTLEGKGGFNALLEGVVIDVKDGSGLIYRCPECRRVVDGMNCPIHGRVKPVPDLRIKAIVDDGTGAVMCVFNREQTEKILGMTVDEAMKKVQENMGISTVITEMIEDKLIARPIRVRGNVISEEKYGLRMFVKDFSIPDVKDIAKNAQKMLDEMEW